MGIVIGVVNQKGGVGKTTTAVNVSAGLAMLGKKVLVVDFDPQGNATTGYGIKKKTLGATSYNLVMGEVRPQEAIVPTRYNDVYIIPATSKLCEAEPKLATMKHKVYQLRKAILQVKDEYDIIMIDSLPSLGVLAMNTLVASDTIIVPMVCEHFALEGLAQLMLTLKKVKKVANPTLSIMGIVFTMLDKRLTASNEIMREIKKSFEDILFKTEIPRNVRISEAQSHGEPICYFDKTSKGADAYKRLSKEVLERCREIEKVTNEKD